MSGFPRKLYPELLLELVQGKKYLKMDTIQGLGYRGGRASDDNRESCSESFRGRLLSEHSGCLCSDTVRDRSEHRDVKPGLSSRGHSGAGRCQGVARVI